MSASYPPYSTRKYGVEEGPVHELLRTLLALGRAGVSVVQNQQQQKEGIEQSNAATHATETAEAGYVTAAQLSMRLQAPQQQQGAAPPAPCVLQVVQDLIANTAGKLALRPCRGLRPWPSLALSGFGVPPHPPLTL
jgi:hypothetical protein